MDSMLIWFLGVSIVDMAIAIAALIGLRYSMAFFTGVHVKDELDKKDNFAFGMVVAGAVFALGLVMSAAISGDVEVSLGREALNVSIYALTGIVLLKLGLLVQDNVMLKGFCLRDQLRSENKAAALVSVANLIAVGIIIKSAIGWVESDTYTGLPSVLIVFVASQIVLVLVTALRAMIYRKRHNGASWQEAIKKGNLALAMRYAGQIVATALSISAIGGLVNYLPGDLHWVFLAWLGFGLVIFIGLWLLYRLILPILLSGVDIVEEVDRQENFGVASIEAAIFMSIAVLFNAFLL